MNPCLNKNLTMSNKVFVEVAQIMLLKDIILNVSCSLHLHQHSTHGYGRENKQKVNQSCRFERDWLHSRWGRTSNISISRLAAAQIQYKS